MLVVPIAHQGGWDEVLIFAVPVLLYAGIRLWERRRNPDDGAASTDGDPEVDEPAPADRPEGGG